MSVFIFPLNARLEGGKWLIHESKRNIIGAKMGGGPDSCEALEGSYILQYAQRAEEESIIG